jgi:hypothetical protein
MSGGSPSKAQLRQMIEERLAKLRWALDGMEATGNYTTAEQEMHERIVATVDALERRIRDALTD